MGISIKPFSLKHQHLGAYNKKVSQQYPHVLAKEMSLSRRNCLGMRNGDIE
jgi:hypothetical protein